MPDRKFATDLGSWKRLGRRWIVILSAMLCGNFGLIVLAVAGFGGATPNSGAGDSVVAVGERRDEVAKIAATVVPAPAQVASAKTESIVQTEPQPKQASEPEQQAATEAAKVIQEDAVPQVKDEASDAFLAEAGMVIVNPLTTGGTVHFVVEEEIYSLSPGTYRRFAGKEPKRIVFHKGDDRSDAEHELETGLFAFAVGSGGWELVPVDLKDSQKLLRGCRLATK